MSGAERIRQLLWRKGWAWIQDRLLFFFSFFFLVSARAISDGIRYWALAGPFVRPSIIRKKIHTITRKHRGGAAYSQ
jgi:hypothetical protein